MNRRAKRYLVRGTLAVVLVPLALFGGLLFFAKIESTPAGVHERLMLPLFGMGHVKVAMPGGTADATVIPGLLDGPVVRTSVNGSWSASWFCEDQVRRQEGSGAELRIACAGKQHAFAIPATRQAEPAVVPMPAKLLVLSDIEGNIAFLDSALRKLDVVGADGAWNYGANRLVIAGDAVDRGRDVFAVLWRLHGLALQAKAAGGSVHVVLGNHEQYVLRGNLAKAHPEHVFALEQLGGAASAFGADTVIGAWLREQPVLVKVGKVLVAHGGISAAVAQQGLTVDQINTAMRRYWRAEPVAAAELDAVLGNSGVTQYRGYLQADKERYPMASAADVAQVLRAFDANTIVVGHTIVEKVTGLYDKRVYAINVNSNEAAPEALLFVDGVATVVDTGSPRALPAKGARSVRPINLLGGEDWRTLAQVTRRSYQLSQLPSPY